MAVKLYEQTTGKKSGSKEKPGSCPQSEGVSASSCRMGSSALRRRIVSHIEARPCNLERLCEEHLAGRYRIQIIDLTKNPQIAHTEQITALPALRRKHSFQS
jgi:KaiB domain